MNANMAIAVCISLEIANQICSTAQTYEGPTYIPSSTTSTLVYFVVFCGRTNICSGIVGLALSNHLQIINAQSNLRQPFTEGHFLWLCAFDVVFHIVVVTVSFPAVLLATTFSTHELVCFWVCYCQIQTFCVCVQCAFQFIQHVAWNYVLPSVANSPYKKCSFCTYSTGSPNPCVGLCAGILLSSNVLLAYIYTQLNPSCRSSTQTTPSTFLRLSWSFCCHSWLPSKFLHPMSLLCANNTSFVHNGGQRGLCCIFPRPKSFVLFGRRSLFWFGCLNSPPTSFFSHRTYYDTS